MGVGESSVVYEKPTEKRTDVNRRGTKFTEKVKSLIGGLHDEC